MWVLLYLAGVLAALLLLQAVVLAAFREPLQWTFGASSEQSKKLKLTLKLVLQGTLLGSIFLFPLLVGSTPAAYYGPLLRGDLAYQFLVGEVVALALLGLIFGIELAGGWIVYRARFPAKKAITKSTLSALSSLTVVGVEEPIFRGIVLTQLLAGTPALVAVPLSAAVFSAAHYIRKVKTYWPAVGLAVLGLWLGVAYLRTGALWLPMGLHSGGILAIGIHRCFTQYRGPAWLVGTQTYPIAGLISIGIMLAGTALTWWLAGPGPQR